jgi:membrane protein
MALLSFKYSELKEINLKDFFWRLYTKAFDEEDLLSNAAQVAYFFLFALFPLLLFLVSIFGIVLGSDKELRAEMFQYLQQTMPGSAYDLVKSTVDQVTESSSGGKLTFGLLVALYSASAGLDSLRIGLNGVYNLAEKRPWWKTKLLSIAMTLGLGALLTLALGIIFYGGKFVELIFDSIGLGLESPFVIGVLQFAIMAIVLVTMFALVYSFLPQHKKPGWTWITPGAIVGIILWLVLSFAFRLYLSYFNTYDATYGSLGAVIILMLWLYLTALVILFGGSMNAVLQEFTDPEAAEAGAIKAHAKEAVANPEASKTKTVEDKKAEILPAMAQRGKDDAEVKTAAEERHRRSLEPVGEKKSPVKLAVGLVVGLVENIFFSNKKR